MKDMMGAALLGELIAQLSRSTMLRQALSEIAPGEAETVIARAVREVERFVANEQAGRQPASPVSAGEQVHSDPGLQPQAPLPPRQESVPQKPVVPRSFSDVPPVKPMVPPLRPVQSGQPGSSASPSLPEATVPSPAAPLVRPDSVLQPGAASQSPSGGPSQQPLGPPTRPGASAQPGAIQESRPDLTPPLTVTPQSRPLTAAQPPKEPVTPQSSSPIAVLPPKEPVNPQSGPPIAAHPPKEPIISPSWPPVAAPPQKEPLTVQSVTPIAAQPSKESVTPQSRPPIVAQPHNEPLPPQPAPPAAKPAGTSIFRHKPFPFEDERAYVLAASLISMNDFPSSAPFRVEGAGFDEGTELFAVDHAGIRFYLSLLSDQDASVSKTGILLLNKQEVLRHRVRHERLINTLRMRGLILPAESGTVIRGKDDLVRRVDFRLHALLEILLGLSSTNAWHLHVSVLDSRIQQVLPAEGPPARTGRQAAERGRGVAGPKRTDVKMLDRLLTREKKIAETILQSISAAADHYELEYLIGLAGGTSDSWKVILKAVFQVSQSRYPHFIRAVVECQDAHAMIEPMLVLAGGTESFSLSM